MAERVVKTMKHHYVAFMDKPDVPRLWSLPSSNTMSATFTKH